MKTSQANVYCPNPNCGNRPPFRGAGVFPASLSFCPFCKARLVDERPVWDTNGKSQMAIVFDADQALNELDAPQRAILRKIDMARQLGFLTSIGMVTVFLLAFLLLSVWLIGLFVVFFATNVVCAWFSFKAVCPRCGGRFHKWGPFAVYWNRRCLHCKLPLDLDPENS